MAQAIRAFWKAVDIVLGSVHYLLTLVFALLMATLSSVALTDLNCNQAVSFTGGTFIFFVAGLVGAHWWCAEKKITLPKFKFWAGGKT